MSAAASPSPPPTWARETPTSNHVVALCAALLVVLASILIDPSREGATLFGVAAGGAPGARQALDILRDEFIRTLKLCGAAGPQGLPPDLLRYRHSNKETT